MRQPQATHITLSNTNSTFVSPCVRTATKVRLMEYTEKSEYGMFIN